MNQKYHEFTGKFLPILVVSGLLALLVRLKIMDWKPDGFFFNMIFVLMLVLFITMYSHIVLLGEELIKFFTRLFRKKSMEVSQIEEDKNQILEENKQNSEDIQTLKENKLKVEDDKPIEFSDIEKIRIRAKSREVELIQEKLELIVQYTKEKLALYTTDEDLYKLCDYLVIFLREGKIENINPIKITVLSTTDLMHFGWNVWNHYKGKNQRIDVAEFLKTVFHKSFREIEETKTIEKLLTSRGKEGLIIIEKNLLQ